MSRKDRATSNKLLIVFIAVLLLSVIIAIITGKHAVDILQDLKLKASVPPPPDDWYTSDEYDEFNNTFADDPDFGDSSLDYEVYTNVGDNVPTEETETSGDAVTANADLNQQIIDNYYASPWADFVGTETLDIEFTGDTPIDELTVKAVINQIAYSNDYTTCTLVSAEDDNMGTAEPVLKHYVVKFNDSDTYTIDYSYNNKFSYCLNENDSGTSETTTDAPSAEDIEGVEIIEGTELAE